MKTTQLQSTPGFVIYDIDGAQNYVGPARLGAKLIPSNATMLVRHQTYVFATLGMQRSGATIGLKSDPADAVAAVESLATELAEEFSSQKLLTTPGLRLNSEILAPVLAYDQRNPIANDIRDGVSFADELLGVGAAAAAAGALAGGQVDGQAVGQAGGQAAGLAGRGVAIEGFGPAGLAIAREVLAQGTQVLAVSNAKGCVSGNFSSAALADALLGSASTAASNGATDSNGATASNDTTRTDEEVVAALVDSHGGTAGKPWEIWAQDNVDAIFCGSKPGALSGEGATQVAEKSTAGNSTTGTPIVVVAWSPAAIASKALAILRKAGTLAIADFVSAVGPTLSWWASEDTDHDQLRNQTAEVVAGVMSETAGHDDGHYMAACYRAEQFMSTWLDELPFGRPLG